MNSTALDLKQTFTNYWNYLPLKTACKLNLFDNIFDGFNTLELLQDKLAANSKALSFLLEALVQLKTLTKNHYKYHLTTRGEILTAKHPKSLKYACILWGEEHLTAWQNLELTILNGEPSFEQLYNSKFFDYLKNNDTSNEIYHKAMYEYARDDYEKITEVIDFTKHKTILDVGGGLGALLKAIKNKIPISNLYLLESENVVKLLPENYSSSFSSISGDFFIHIPPIADAIILSRIIHDWDDKKALIILQNCYNALPNGGQLYLIEIFKEKIEDGGQLLCLNMQLMCNSFERNSDEYKILLNRVGFSILETKDLNTLQSILIAKK